MLETILTRLGLAAALQAMAWARKSLWHPLLQRASRRLQTVRQRRARRAYAEATRTTIAGAASAGEVVVTSAVGSNPTKVTWAGAKDEITFHYTDLPKYKSDMGRQRVPHLRTTCCGRPPRVGERRKLTLEPTA